MSFPFVEVFKEKILTVRCAAEMTSVLTLVDAITVTNLLLGRHLGFHLWISYLTSPLHVKVFK